MIADLPFRPRGNIEAVQEDRGSGTLTVRDSDIGGDIETEGVTLVVE